MKLAQELSGTTPTLGMDKGRVKEASRLLDMIAKRKESEQLQDGIEDV